MKNCWDAEYTECVRKDSIVPKGFRTNPGRVARSHRKSAETLRAKALFDRVERERKAKLKEREGL